MYCTNFVCKKNSRMHPENVLYSVYLAGDDAMSARALKIILECQKKERIAAEKRRKENKPPHIRKFRVPIDDEFNWTADNPMDMLKWDKRTLKLKTHCPPLLRNYTPEQLKDRQTLDVPNILGHK